MVLAVFPYFVLRETGDHSFQLKFMLSVPSKEQSGTDTTVLIQIHLKPSVTLCKMYQMGEVVYYPL
jgi:hypothetical protein